MYRGWNKYAQRAYDELSAEDSQEQQEMDDLEELLDARDNFFWSEKDEDFDDMRLVDQDEASELSDIEEEEVMESIDLRV